MHANQYLKYTPHNPTSAKQSAITALFDQADNVVSSEKDKIEEKHHILAALQQNSYPKEFIQRTVKKHPRRKNVVVNTFIDQVIVTRWVCSREKHAEVSEHYHIAVKLDRNRRWLRVKSSLKASHGITVNFSSEHSNYYSAWRYVTKSDQDYVQSPGHHDLTFSAPPRTMAATQRKCQNKMQMQMQMQTSPRKS